MKSNTVNLSQIFLAPLAAQDGSFIKIVGSGTGLGKSYSSILSLQHYIEFLNAKGNQKPIVSIFAAPQHNQISFPETVSKKLESLGTCITRVKPISSFALSDLDKDINAYDIAKSLFFVSDGQTANAIYEGVHKACKEVDRQANNATAKNPPKLEQVVTGIRYGKLNIDGVLGKLETEVAQSSVETIDGVAGEFDVPDAHESVQFYQDKLKGLMADLAQKLQSLFLKSYSNLSLYNLIKGMLSSVSLKEFREVTATFYPILHYQLSEQKHALLGMTAKKLLTRHYVFTPRYHKNRNVITWSAKPYLIDEIISGESSLNNEAKLALENKDAYDLAPSCEKLFESDFHLYIDESDKTKEIITEVLHRDIIDDGLVQANGALSKEAGDSLYSANHISLENRIPDNDAEAFRYLSNGLFDDSLIRQVSKDILRNVQDAIIRNISKSDWCKPDQDPNELEATLTSDVRFIARALLTAPYCTVDAGIDRTVFETTSVFGGEMFGFIGSRNIDEFVVISTPSAIRITKPEYISDSQERIPLKSLFLLFTINWFIFQSLRKHPGSEISADKLSAKLSEHIAALLGPSNPLTATHGVERLKKLLQGLYSRPSSGVLGVSKPFRLFTENSGAKAPVYHTACAYETIKRANILDERVNGVFSPTAVNVDDLLGGEGIDFLSSTEQQVDMTFGYAKAHTIYGLAQIENKDYLISHDKSHVAFPIKYRREAAESFLTRLIASTGRRVCCFLMSATGAYENSHIPAWSIEALRYLCQMQSITLLTMSQQDYEVTSKKQKERGKLKSLAFNDLDNINKGALHKIADMRIQHCLKADSELGNSEEGVVIPSSITRQVKDLSNIHKRNELDNILKSIDFVHHPNDYGVSDEQPAYALVLAQTQRKFQAVIHLMASFGASVSSRRYKVSNLLNTNELSAGQTPYGIFCLSTVGKSSRFEEPSRDTLVVCYTAALDKALTKIFKEPIRNPNSKEYKLKELLGIKAQAPLRDATATDFNPINYLLSDFHGCNVVLVSAYESAARGINLIVNKQTQLHEYLKKKAGKANSSSPNPPRKERDLDYIFMAAPPFYSEVRQNIPNGMSHRLPQDRYFARCNKYLHYIEWLARRAFAQADESGSPILNNEIDLLSPYIDESADEYFALQHAISLFCTLQQSFGRIERTNAAQHQQVFLCRGVQEVIIEGIRAITRHFDNETVEQMVGAMSVVNAQLIKQVLAGSIFLPESRNTNTVISLESSSKRFEALKQQSFLKAIKRYREFSSSEEVDELTLLEIEFYEAFRSSQVWETGIPNYLSKLRSVVDRMPRGLKRKYTSIIDMMFKKFDRPLDDYFSINGRPINLAQKLSTKSHARANPYFCQVEDGYLYPEPWFLADLDGNYGELVAKLAIDSFCSATGGMRLLDHKRDDVARKGYEFADFYIQYGNSLLAVDAKHYTSLRSRQTNSQEDLKWTIAFFGKLQNKQSLIQLIDPLSTVKVVAINCAFTDETPIAIKTVGVNCYAVNSESNISEIAYRLAELAAHGVNNL